MKRIVCIGLFFSLLGTLSALGKPVFFTDAGGIYHASSELEKPAAEMEIGRYSPRNLFDHDLSTSWVEGDRGPGIGSYVCMGIEGNLKRYIIVYNGYQTSKSLFNKNNRVRKLKISLYAGFTRESDENQFGFTADTVYTGESSIIILQDRMGPQRFINPFTAKETADFLKKEKEKYRKETKTTEPVKDFFFMKFEIVSVYRGSKWNDTCITGIEFTNNPDGSYIPVNEKIKSIYQSSNGGDIYVKTSAGRVLTLISITSLIKNRDIDDKEFVTLALMDVSTNREWAIIDYQYGSTEGGNIEETPHLWSVRRMEEVPESLLKEYGSVTPLDFLTSNGSTYLETYEGKNILLEDIGTDMDQKS